MINKTRSGPTKPQALKKVLKPKISVKLGENASKRVSSEPVEKKAYAFSIPERLEILDVLQNRECLTFRELVSELNIKGQEKRSALKKRVSAMHRDGQIVINENGAYTLAKEDDFITGKVEVHRDGYGFLLREDEEDIYLSFRELRDVIHGDIVKASLIGFNKNQQLEGKLIEIVERKTERIVARLKFDKKELLAIPDNPRIRQTIKVNKFAEINNLYSENKLEEGDYVVIQIDQYPSKEQLFNGHIIEWLGSPTTNTVIIDVALRTHDIPYEWPETVSQQVSALSNTVKEEDKKNRIDLRDLPLVTIDGEDARDFDDAVYCEPADNGGYRLIVAIADVANYVDYGSSLDMEARSRGNSVYFPGRVVPMLPEILSNGLCSLNPEVDRLCMAVEIILSAEGEMDSFEFFEGVMHSHARLTYTEVAEVLGLQGLQPRKGLLQRLHKVLPHLNHLYNLFEVLTTQRKFRGAIDFETTETRIVFDAEKKIEEIIPVVRNDAHRIIEECMLCANVAAAKFLEKSGLDGLYRVHEGPKEEKLKNLRAYLKELMLSLGGGEKPDPKDFQNLIASITERPDAHLIQIMLLRSMSQAVYSPENEGHFGLSYEAYTHFTSPIRRYPDLLVHRAIKYAVRKRQKTEHIRKVKGADVIAKKEIYPYKTEEMVAEGIHSSMTERRADDAVRDVVTYLKCEYLLDQIGNTFSGVISGVTGFGLFVELKDLYVEGLIHISELDEDYYRYDQTNQRLVGEQSGRMFNLGDSLDVLVANVDMDERKIDLCLIDRQEVTRQPRRKSKKKSQSNKSRTPKSKASKTRKKKGKTVKRRK